MAKTKTEIHVTTVFDGELDAADVFVSLIAQKYGQNTGKENLAKTQDLGYNKDEVQKNQMCIRDSLIPLCGTGQSESASACGTFWGLTQTITHMKR